MRAAEQLAARLPPRRLAELATGLTCGYRAGQSVSLGPDEVATYCAYRLPATYAAARSCLLALATTCPDVAPRHLLDVGGGAGAAAFAAAAVFGSLGAVTVLDQNEHMLRAGEEIAALVPGVLPAETSWVRAGLLGATALPPADLVVATYLLGELPPAALARLVHSMAEAAGSAVLVVEPGTPAGHRRVLDARAALLDAGWTVAAPCPHDARCPMEDPDWCHFSVRVPRSRLHRLAKSADLGYEDEKYSYVAAVRGPCPRPAARVVRHPDWRRSAAVLRLCTGAGVLETRTVPRSAGDAYRAARRVRWGDPWPPQPGPVPPLG